MQDFFMIFWKIFVNESTDEGNGIGRVQIARQLPWPDRAICCITRARGLVANLTSENQQ